MTLGLWIVLRVRFDKWVLNGFFEDTWLSDKADHPRVLANVVAIQPRNLLLRLRGSSWTFFLFSLVHLRLLSFWRADLFYVPRQF